MVKHTVVHPYHSISLSNKKNKLLILATIWKDLKVIMGFPGSSVGKEAACKTGGTGDVGSVSGLGRSPGEGSGKPLYYSSLGNPRDRGAWQATVHGVTRSRT